MDLQVLALCVETEVQMLIDAVDTNGKGKLDYGEFVAITLHLQKMANDEHLRRAFSYFDKDGNGYIEPEELREALAEDATSDSIDVANDILHEVDTNKDGKISYDEFVAMMKTERIGGRLEALLKRKIQQSQYQIDEGWLFTHGW
ncbi:hypothetical protein HPP92_019282 [Vanilla planifolia]|uniref:EF-hand domain-containing protein n=1 Tax=Vanilla planifolia TaxID=51239 RepID=A0A835Q5H9_VANPL|nr:hypothetical protein HPP92_019282 [Vanilla planifolia]